MLVLSMMGRGGVATRLTSSNTAQSLATGLLVVNKKKMSEFVVQCDPRQANSVAVTWGGTTPTQGASAVGVVLDPGDALRLVGEYNCSSFQYISAVAGSHGVLQLQPGY